MKFEIGQLVYVNLNETIKQYIIRWYLQKGTENRYIVCDMWKDTVFIENVIFSNLEDAKENAYKYLNWKIEEIQKVITEIQEVETIELTPETI